MKLENLKEEWAKDSVINENKLGEEALRSSNLHSKYLNMLMDVRKLLAGAKREYDTRRRFKSRYYKGELTKEELNSNGLEQYQYAKPLKAELDEILAADEEIKKLYARVEYCEVMLYFLESVMSQIRARGYDIKTAVTWRQFISGN